MRLLGAGHLYIEYKLELFDKGDEKKRAQFLGSVSAFPNAFGGDILVGVRAIDGIPLEFVGLDQSVVDSEALHIQQVLGTSIEPPMQM